MAQVVVSGGGPAGLLTGILLGRRGYNVTVMEKSAAPDVWTDKSYFMGINARGMSALEKAGVLDAVKTVSVNREGIAMHLPDGEVKFIPRNPPTIGVSRPRLISILTDIARSEGNVTLRSNCHVTNFKQVEDGSLQITLSDGKEEFATHLIGADGKWSAVRNAAAEFEKSQENPSFDWQLHTEDSWGIRLNIPQIPAAWRRNIVHAMKPKTLVDGSVYAIISESDYEQRCAAWLVLHTPIIKHYPELAPEDGEGMP